MHTLMLDPPTSGKLIGYARVSLDDQKLDLQYDALTRAGVERTHIYEDHASGAPNVHRPGFDAMWRDLRTGDTLVVWKLDRLGRSVVELVIVLDRIEKLGARLVILTELIDTSTPTGRFTFHILASLAEMERSLIKERTLAGLAAATARGRKSGRKPKLTGEIEENAIRLLRTGMKVPKVAPLVGVAESTLYDAVRGRLAQRIAAVEETEKNERCNVLTE